MTNGCQHVPRQIGLDTMVAQRPLLSGLLIFSDHVFDFSSWTMTLQTLPTESLLPNTGCPSRQDRMRRPKPEQGKAGNGKAAWHPCARRSMHASRNSRLWGG